jgi:L-threonylcarbamoyladenylate synthase
LTVLEAPEAPGAEPSRSAAAVRTAGQDRVHYAPRTAALLLARAALADWRVPVGKRIGFLGFAPAGFPVALSLRLPSDPAGAAQQLYGALHRLDQAGLDLVVIEAPPADAAWAGVRDRLLRATAGGRAAPLDARKL